ncbi:14-3-3 protein [Fistulina hepatica ATCC 64428]|uniref:14-3-3 protein n=1 Tax=Fistulina hepatica ATCC 64428 TaxID=1128425 RepID=A0A0D7A0J8_9AGAR|nr:14-3-3 protein [Fistulina hepatica ATCC 64428]
MAADKVAAAADRHRCLFLAELAGEAERYHDVVAQIKTIIKTIDSRLSVAERNLLSVAYKNITNGLRNSWRVVEGVESSHTLRIEKRQATLIARQRERIQNELADVCRDIVALLDDSLIPVAEAGEESVFYSKMKGDYYRYLAEFAHKRDRDKYAELSLSAYKTAYQRATSTLDPVHPTRLGLALNFSVFFHDVRKSPERACHLAKSAFDDAIAAAEAEPDAEGLKDSLMILQLLKEDLILWAKEMDDVPAEA